MIINSQLVPDLQMISTKQENSVESLQDEDLLQQQHCKDIKLESFQTEEDCNNNLNNTSNRNISQKESKKMFKTEFKFQQIDQLNTKCCTGCQLSIEDKYVFNLMNTYWHEDCLQCSQCRIQLQKTCFFKNGLLYCKEDYLKQFGTRCNACYELIISNELVMRFLINPTTANEQLLSYHLNCFKCLTCERQLQKGDEFVLKNEGIYCKHDFEQQSHAAQHSTLINRLNSKPLYHSFEHDEVTQKPKQTQRKSTSSRRITKRPRTILNAVQRYDFREAFKQSPKPCRKVREHLASKTGLSVRVVQVWFQNERAKVKKMQRRQQQHLINQKLNGKKGIKLSKKMKKGKNRNKFDSDLNSEENSLAANEDEDEYDELDDDESEQSSDDDLYDESDEDLEDDDEDDDIGLKEMLNPVQSPGNLNTNNTSSSSSSSTSSLSNNSDFILQQQQQQHNYQQQHHMYQQHSHQMHHFAHQQQPIDRLFSMQNAYFV